MRDRRLTDGVPERTLALAAGLLLAMLAGAAIAPAQTYSVLYTFTGGADGGSPRADLIADSAGNLYGTTSYGGSTSGSCAPQGCGVVFKLDPQGSETVLYSFTGGSDGGYPEAGLIRDTAGNLYGTAVAGGDLSGACAPYGCGVVFELSPAGEETVLHAFTGPPDGALPEAPLLRDSAGDLYGTTQIGGQLLCSNFACGVIFKVTSTGTETVLYRFTGGADGGGPFAGLTRDGAGNLYGTTYYGGNLSCAYGRGCGVVFEVSKQTEQTLFTFSNDAGAGPVGGVVLDSADNMYGTTAYGGDGSGVVFQLQPMGGYTILWDLPGSGYQGEYPFAGVIRDAAGNLYGTASQGGIPDGGWGIVFGVTPYGEETPIYKFKGGADGATPTASLLAYKGYLYGTTEFGGLGSGDAGYGVVFKISIP